MLHCDTVTPSLPLRCTATKLMGHPSTAPDSFGILLPRLTVTGRPPTPPAPRLRRDHPALRGVVTRQLEVDVGSGPQRARVGVRSVAWRMPVSTHTHTHTHLNVRVFSVLGLVCGRHQSFCRAHRQLMRNSPNDGRVRRRTRASTQSVFAALATSGATFRGSLGAVESSFRWSTTSA